MKKYISTIILIGVALFLEWTFRFGAPVILGGSTPIFFPFKMYNAGCPGYNPFNNTPPVCDPVLYNSGIILSIVFWLVALFVLLKIQNIFLKILATIGVLFVAYLISMR